MGVVGACTACGGGPAGFVRRSGPEGHADWCGYVNPRTMVSGAFGLVYGLPVDRRAAVLALRAEGGSVGFIARTLNVPEWTVRDDLTDGVGG